MSVSYERDGLALTDVDADPWIATLTRGRTGVTMTLDDLRWLVLTSGPAALYELQHAEEVAGDGGGPSPAVPDATEPADGPEPDADDEAVEPDLFASIPDDRADPHTVACPACKSPPGTACMTPGGMVARTHAARKRLVDGS